VSAIGLDIVFPFGKMSTKSDQAQVAWDHSIDLADYTVPIAMGNSE
jgi:hypothetical protein